MKTSATGPAGFTLVEIMIVVAIIGLLAAIAVPNYARARQNSVTNACINNLREIDSAKQQWALEAGKTTGDTPLESDIQPYLGRGVGGSLARVYCPLVRPTGPMAGYTIHNIGTPPVCNQQTPQEHPAQLE